MTKNKTKQDTSKIPKDSDKSSLTNTSCLEEIEKKILKKFGWKGNREEDRAFADNMLKYIGQEELAKQHNDSLKQAISLTWKARQNQDGNKMSEYKRGFADGTIKQIEITKELLKQKENEVLKLIDEFLKDRAHIKEGVEIIKFLPFEWEDFKAGYNKAKNTTQERRRKE